MQGVQCLQAKQQQQQMIRRSAISCRKITQATLCGLLKRKATVVLSSIRLRSWRAGVWGQIAHNVGRAPCAGKQQQQIIRRSVISCRTDHPSHFMCGLLKRKATVVLSSLRHCKGMARPQVHAAWHIYQARVEQRSSKQQVGARAGQ